MNLEFEKAKQAEIIKSTQKDSIYTDNLGEDFSDLLRFLIKPKAWVRYCHLCKLLAEITYHEFLSINRLQTLGEEYTGIVQVDENCISLPKKTVQLVAIILQFGGESLLFKVLSKFENTIKSSKELRPEAQEILSKIILLIKISVPYVKSFHKTWFYLYPNKYQISKRLLGINYILVRNWLNSDQPLYGYRILGILTFAQLTLSLIVRLKKINKELEILNVRCNEKLLVNTIQENVCHLCLETRRNTSLTTCGHLFCWECIIDWIGEREECPICREQINKSNIVQLMNYH